MDEDDGDEEVSSEVEFWGGESPRLREILSFGDRIRGRRRDDGEEVGDEGEDDDDDDDDDDEGDEEEDDDDDDDGDDEEDDTMQILGHR